MFKCNPIIRVVDSRKGLSDEHSFGDSLLQISESNLDNPDRLTLKHVASSSSMNVMSIMSELSLLKPQPSFYSDGGIADTVRDKTPISPNKTPAITPISPNNARYVDMHQYKFLTKFERDSDRQQYTSYIFSLINNGDRAYDECHYNKACNHYQAALSSIFQYWNRVSKVAEIMEKLPDLFLSMMEAYFEHDDLLAAINIGKEYLRLFPNELAPYQALSFCYRANDEYKEAVRICNRAMSVYPNESSLFSLRGKAYYDHGEYKLALRDFDRCLELSRLVCGESATRGRVLKSWLRHSMF